MNHGVRSVAPKRFAKSAHRRQTDGGLELFGGEEVVDLTGIEPVTS